jgi:hypothetical protein
MIRFVKFAWLLAVLWVPTAHAADLDATQVREILAAATPERPADLAGKSLENLDLSNLDFERSDLAGANLYGTKLVDSDLAGANLSGARLDLAWIMRANFTNADLSNASLLALVVSSGWIFLPPRHRLSEAPTSPGHGLSLAWPVLI